MTDNTSKNPSNKLMIRNSTAEFLIFTQQAGENGIEVRYENETIWLSQKLMAELFDVDVRTISEHLKNIFSSGELQEEAVIRKFRITASDGKSYNTQFYNLDAIISIGYRVNSKRATQFRQWATRLDLFLEFEDRKVLENVGNIGAKIAKDHAESEFEKYRIIQDRLFESDFDRASKVIEQQHNGKVDET